MKKRTYITILAFIMSLSLSYGQTDDDVIETDDEEIVLPEGMLQDIDELMREYHASQYLSIDDECKSSKTDPEFDDETYIQRLRRMPTIIEMPYNNVVRKFIDRYTKKDRRGVSMMLGASNFYMPFFEQALETYNMPLELKYLPIIESALNPKDVSSVGATGLWQFMLATGKQYGLRVNSLVDERCDVELASYAAARYLRDLHRIFNDWHLAIAAYNCGPENVNKAIRRAGGVKDYWQIYPYLPSETRGYVPAFIAANYVMNYYCEHGICPMRTDLPAKTDTIVVDRDVHLKQVSEVLGIDIKLLRSLNPQYRRDIVNGSYGGAVLRLPYNNINDFIDKQDSIYSYHADEYAKRATVDVNDEPRPAQRSVNHEEHKSRNVAQHHEAKRHDRDDDRRSKKKGKKDRDDDRKSKKKGKKDRDDDRKSKKKGKKDRDDDRKSKKGKKDRDDDRKSKKKGDSKKSGGKSKKRK